MRKLAFIWKYLTDSRFRFWVDFCARKEHIDRNMALIQENLELMSHPMFVYRGGVDFGFSGESWEVRPNQD